MTREQLLNLIRDEPYKLGLCVGFKDLTQLHNSWIRSFLFDSDDQTLLAHRGSYKTSCLSVAIALLIILEPKKNIIFLRKTDDDVTEIVAQVRKILLSGAFRAVVQRLHGRPLCISKQNLTEIDTNLNRRTQGAPQLLGLGIKTSLTGKHADIVITDDIVNLQDRISPAERERIKLAYMELQNVKNRGGRMINTGTPWHKDDAIALMPNTKRFNCYDTGLISRDKLEDLRKSMSDSLFAANYELKHIADGDVMFHEPKFTADEELIYGGYGHVDAAYGGSDSTAYTIFNRLPDGRLIGFGQLWDRHVDDCQGAMAKWHERLRAGSIFCETNGDKGYLAASLRKTGWQVRPYAEKMNKYIKISTYLRKHWDEITWLEATSPEYINQILDYNENAAHDDAPDSAASLIREMDRTPRYNSSINGGL